MGVHLSKQSHGNLRNGRRISAWVRLALTLASVVGTYNASMTEFASAVAMSYLTVIMFIITIVLFTTGKAKPSKDPSPTPNVERTPGVSPETPSMTRVQADSGKSSNAARAVFIFALIPGLISLFVGADMLIGVLPGGRYTGSGGMGGLIDYVILAVSIPATLISLFIAGVIWLVARTNNQGE